MILTSVITLGAILGQAPITDAPKPRDLLDLRQLRIVEYKKIQDVRDQIRASDPKAGVYPPSLLNDRTIKGMGLDEPGEQTQLRDALLYRFDLGTLKDYHPVDLKGNDRVLSYTVVRVDDKGEPKFMSLKQGFTGQNLQVEKVRITETPLPTPNGPPPAEPTVSDQYSGIFVPEDLKNTLSYFEQHGRPGVAEKVKAEVIPDTSIPAQLYENKEGDLAVVLDKVPPNPLLFPLHPEFVVFRASPQDVDNAYTNHAGPMPGMDSAIWGVKEGNEIVDFEHILREQYVALQELRDKVKAQHPTTADFPPEMLQTDEFKSTGLQLPRDNAVLMEALSFTPEGSRLHGFRPMDFAHDKAAQDTVLVATPAGAPLAETLAKAFDKNKPYLLRLKVTQTKNVQPGTPARELYFGPISLATFDELKTAAAKGPANATVDDVKDQDIPLSVYTNDAGDVVFVLDHKPPRTLLVPQAPMIVLATDPVDKVTAMLAKDNNLQNVAQELHRVQNVRFAVLAP